MTPYELAAKLKEARRDAAARVTTPARSKAAHISLKRTGKCKVCTAPSYSPMALYCSKCWQFDKAEVTHKLVRAAIKRGELKPIKGQLCTDCGAPAKDYDHRDYSKPLEVDPVCRSCNLNRGPAKVHG